MKRVGASIICLLAAACASYDGRSLQPGVSDEAQVRASMGQPALDLPAGDGTHRLVYPRGPLGTQTFMADIGKDGKLIALNQVLNEETFNQVRPGLTRDDILRMIGPPGETMGFSRTQTVSWDYRYQDAWGYPAIFSVIFDRNWIVVSKFTQRIEKERSRF